MSSKIDRVGNQLLWKDTSSKNRFFLAWAGAESTKSRGGERENNTRAIVWAAFGLVSRVVTWLQANDSRFLSTTILYSEDTTIIVISGKTVYVLLFGLLSDWFLV